MIFATADLHFEHKNIIEYTERKYQSVDEMNCSIVDIWNNTVSELDHIYILGDFSFKKIYYYVKELNGIKTFVKGNHEKWIKTESLVMKYMSEKILMVHNPRKVPKDLDPSITMVLCGHVHDKWTIIPHNDIFIFNVGWDIWGKPIEIETLIKSNRYIRKHDKHTLKNNSSTL